MSSPGSHNQRYRFGSQFEAIVTATSHKKGWYQNWRSKCTKQNVYITCSFGSFFTMMLFGFLSINVERVCEVKNVSGRCCSCLDISEGSAQMKGQEMPMRNSYNNVYYGIVLIVNSLFGMTYIHTAIKDENKYLLFCLAVTQALEITRGIVDIIFEIHGDRDSIRIAREFLLALSVLLMLGSFVLMKHMYKKFGWKIFRRGGAKKSIRQMYKMYQRYRAMNLLDIQSSSMLFMIFIFYMDTVRWNGGWVFIVLVLCDVLSSRYTVKYLKRESRKGVLLGLFIKLFVISWWIVIVKVYITCFDQYADSLELTSPWWHMERYPQLESVVNSYNGVDCLTPETVHDARTKEVLLLNFSQALLFRVGSLIIAGLVTKNFGRGLRDVFYARDDVVQRRKQQKALADKEENLVDGEENVSNRTSELDTVDGFYEDDEEREAVETHYQKPKENSSPYQSKTDYNIYDPDDPEVGEFSDEDDPR